MTDEELSVKACELLQQKPLGYFSKPEADIYSDGFKEGFNYDSQIKKQKEKDAVKQMKRCNDDDTETAHIKADDILCELLKDLGFNDLVDEYNNISKWYS